MMKKLFLFSILAAVLLPATAGAVVFTNMSGRSNMDVVTDSFSNSNTLISQTSHFKNGADMGILADIPGQNSTAFFEDHLIFSGSGNDAELIVQGNLLVLSRNMSKGPAAFSLNSPANVPATGKITRLEIRGAANVNAASSVGNKGTMVMFFQPSSVAFNVYSSGNLVSTQKFGNSTVKIPAMVKRFTNMSSAILPPGFANRSGM